MLTPVESAQVQEVLTEILAISGGRAYFQTVFGGPEFMVALGALAGPASSDQQVAAAAILACKNREWLDNPSWLEMLLDAVRKEGQTGGVKTVPDISAIINRVHKKINILDDVWDAHWLQNGLPFLDRSGLRDTLKEIWRADGRSILRIEGDSRSGKTYSNELLEHASMSMNWAFRVIKVEVEKGSEIGMDALVLSQILVGEMGFPITPDATIVPDRNVPSIPLLQTWILSTARASKARWWLFLDGFSSLPKTNSARQLIQGLAEKIANSSFREVLRLILSDYNEPLSRVSTAKVAFDSADTQIPETSAMTAVSQCLNKLFRELQRVPQEGQLDSLAHVILQPVPADKSWMETVHQRLTAVAKGIRNGQ